MRRECMQDPTGGLAQLDLGTVRSISPYGQPKTCLATRAKVDMMTTQASQWACPYMYAALQARNRRRENDVTPRLFMR